MQSQKKKSRGIFKKVQNILKKKFTKIYQQNILKKKKKQKIFKENEKGFYNCKIF